MRVLLRMAALPKLATLAVLAMWVQSPALALDIGTQVGGKTESAASSVKWTILENEVGANPGETISIRIKGEIPKAWHTYSLKVYPKFGPPTTFIELLPNESALIDGVISSDPKPTIDPKLTKQYKYDVEIFEGAVTFTVPLKVLATANLAAAPVLKFKLKSRICDEHLCKNEAVIEIPFTLTLKKKVEAAPAPAQAPVPTARPKSNGKPAEVRWRLPEDEQRIYATAGDVRVFHLKVDIDEGWHIYTCKKQGDFIPVTTFKIEPAELGVT